MAPVTLSRKEKKKLAEAQKSFDELKKTIAPFTKNKKAGVEVIPADKWVPTSSIKHLASKKRSAGVGIEPTPGE